VERWLAVDNTAAPLLARSFAPPEERLRSGWRHRLWGWK